MPTYEYACKACGEHLEVVQSFKDGALTECPACGGPLRKVFGNIGITFKGSGFYRTDNRASGHRAAGGKVAGEGWAAGDGRAAEGGAAVGEGRAAGTAGGDGAGGSDAKKTLAEASSKAGAKASGPSANARSQGNAAVS